MKRYPYYFVFDVESIGLHGEGFAVGFYVFAADGAIQTEFVFWTDSKNAKGSREDREWVDENVPKHFGPDSYRNTRIVRDCFWDEWMHWEEKGAVMVADCNWPVESNFLSACIADDPVNRRWDGPYPFLDLGSILFALGKDPLEEFPRLPDELPKHDPLKDARQSARILKEVLKLG